MSFKKIISSLSVMSLLAACGSEEKKNTKIQELALSDIMAFPSSDADLVTTDAIPSGTYALKEFREYSDHEGVEKWLYILPLKNPGNPNTTDDKLTVKARWDDTREEGHEQILVTTQILPLKGASQDSVFSLSDERDLSVQAASNAEGSWAMKLADSATFGPIRGLFSGLGILNVKVYELAGYNGVVKLSTNGFVLYAQTSGGGYKTVTKLTFVKI